MTAPTLVDFLRARLDDDERAARACEHWAPPPWVGAFKQVTSEPGGETQVVASTVAAQVSHHIERWEPARVLLDVQAKRRILDEVLPKIRELESIVEGEYNSSPEEAEPLLLALLALPYADHPDYRAEWTP